MHPILTLTLSPALDLSTVVDQVIAGPKLRCSAPQVDPGGGGINVSRAIRILGGDAPALVALGGATGQRVAEALATEGITVQEFPAPGDTRQSLAVRDSAGKQFRFVMPGPDWQHADVADFLDLLRDSTPKGALVILSGSQPPGVAPDFPARLAQTLMGRAQLLIDTSGAPLHWLAQHPTAGISVLRMDSLEAEDLAGHPLPQRLDSADFAAGLVARGVAQTVIVARGPDGTVLVNATERLFCTAADVPVKSKVGAGDSFVAGYVLALSRGETQAAALAKGVAAASAAVMTEGTELCRRADAEALLPLCPVSAL